MFTHLALVSPPVALAIDVFARSLAEIGRADDEDLEALRPCLVASPRTGWDAHRVPFLELDNLLVELHPPAPAQDHVHLLLLLVRVAIRKAIAGRDALVAEARFLQLERHRRQTKLQVRRPVEIGPDVLKEDLEDVGSNFDGAPDLEFRLATVALELEKSGLGYQRVPPGYRFPYGHTHKKQEEVYVVLRGSGRMKLDDEIVELEEWDAVRVPPGTWRGYEAGPEGLEIIVIGAPNLGEAPREDVEGQRDWWAD